MEFPQEILPSNGIKTKEILCNRVARSWDYYSGLKSIPKNIQIYGLPVSKNQTPKISTFAKIPPPTQDSGINPNQPFMVVSYNENSFLFLGIAPKYSQNLRAKDLAFKMPETTLHTETQNLQQEQTLDSLSFTIPEFFVFTKVPKLPTDIEKTVLWDDLTKFWAWLQSFTKLSAAVTPPPLTRENTPLDVLFFVLMMSAYEEPTLLLQVYSAYLRVHFKGCIPNLQTRLLFAQKLGIEVSGPETVEEKLLQKPRLVMAKLRDTKEIWTSRMPNKMKNLTIWIDQFFPRKK